MNMTFDLKPRASARDDKPGLGAEPLYAVIKQSVIDGIQNGALKPGDRLPSESELVERFGVSRMTANRALRELQKEGVIIRHAGVGSFIAEQQPIGHMIEVRNIADEIRGRGHQYHAAVIENEARKSDVDSSPLLGVAIGTSIFHSIIVHYEAGEPLQLEDRYVLAAIAPGYCKMDFSEHTPNEYLTQIAPIERFEHRVRSVVPEPRVRKLLHMRAGEPALVMTRRTWSQGRVASFVTLTHPGNRFELLGGFAGSSPR
jgi:GntR family histidine utilization transcriptional repressor